MFTSFNKKPFFNKALNEYCMQTTLKSTQNMIERLKLKRTIFAEDNKIVLFKNPYPPPNNNIPYIILAISIAPFIYYMLKYKQQK